MQLLNIWINKMEKLNMEMNIEKNKVIIINDKEADYNSTMS